MKRTLLVTFCISTAIFAFAQEKNTSKKLHKNFAPITENLYAAKYETSVGDYQNFLDDLKKSGATETLQQAQYDSTVWDNGSAFMEPMKQHYYSHSAYMNYPIVGVSQKEAKLYCAWLTEQYNANPKRKFERVTFRLPNQEEWAKAAAGENNKAPYPWHGQSTTNAKGCQLANLKVPMQEEGFDFVADGAFLTAPVASYSPNDFGCYCVSGNVAEMVSDGEGIALGGSWNTTEEYLVVAPKPVAMTFTERSWDVGFRVFMEVIEE